MPESASTYLPVLLVTALAVGFAAVLLSLSTVLTAITMRGRRRSPTREQAYECGMPVLSEAHTRFSVKFYLVAMLFILFDVEIVFMYPWAVLYGRDDAARPGLGLGLLFAEVVVFVAVLLVGWLYVVRKGVLQWQTEG